MSFKADDVKAGTLESWEKIYRDNDLEKLPWYSEKIDREMEEAIKSFLPEHATILDLGTGPGTMAVDLARMGHQVTAIDVSPRSIELARQKAGDRSRKVDFMVEDILRPMRLQGRFDAVFDRGCFHTINPNEWPRYIKNVVRYLKPGGLLFLKTFSVKQEGTEGPHRFSPEGLRTLFANEFNILANKESVFPGNIEPPPRALFTVMKQRKHPAWREHFPDQEEEARDLLGFDVFLPPAYPRQDYPGTDLLK